MRHTKLSRQTIHNYTMLGLIKPAERTPSGHRLYGEEVFDRIKKIELLKLHHTLDEVRTMLLAEDEAKAKSEPAA
ncbi:MAG: MerR family DNA-binding transcriptional regulator [Planctomycetes bacterium]|nr:MerR family DNA-binding transcriptional regulator [Planctomycetota bacterium]